MNCGSLIEWKTLLALKLVLPSFHITYCVVLKDKHTDQKRASQDYQNDVKTTYFPDPGAAFTNVIGWFRY